MKNLLSSSIVNPYTTSIGKLLFKPQLENKLQLLVTSFKGSLGNKELSYGITLKNYIPVILTGFSNQEEDVPFFQYPIMFNGPRNEKYIAIDLREYVNSNKLKSFSRDQDIFTLFNRYDGVNFLLCLMGIIDLSIDGDLEWLPKDTVIEAYGYLLSYLIRGVVTLPYTENVDIQYLTILYYFSIFKGERIDNISFDRVKAYMEKMGKKWSLSKKDHEVLISGFIQEQVNLRNDTYCNMDNFLKLISVFMSPDKKQLFTGPILGNVLKNIWMGHGRQNSALMAYENIGVFISMLYSSNKYSTLKDSHITKIMKGSKIDLKKLNQVIESNFKFIQK